MRVGVGVGVVGVGVGVVGVGVGKGVGGYAGRRVTAAKAEAKLICQRQMGWPAEALDRNAVRTFAWLQCRSFP
jgi:hypothetical protein